MLRLATSARVAAFALVLCAAGGSYANTLATTAQVYMRSDPGNYVGGGLGAPSVLWTHGIDGVFSAGSGTDNGVSISYQGTYGWSFDFYAPKYDPVTNTLNGQALKSGLYDGATRYPFNSPTKPGLTIAGAGAGDNIDSGWFYILDFARAPNGDLATLAVDFEQFDENLTESGPGLYGALRFNSDIPIDAPIPEPATSVLMLVGLGVLGLVGRRRAKTH